MPPRKIERLICYSGRSNARESNHQVDWKEAIGESSVPYVSMFIIATPKNSLFLLNASVARLAHVIHC